MNSIQIKEFAAVMKKKSDLLINYFLIGFFLFGVALAFYYDTWFVAIGVGGFLLLAYYLSKRIFPESNLYQYVLSVVMGVFMAQFIYQVRGMFEMHFFAFIASAMLITYRNWKLQIPLALTIFIHHALFGYLQYKGIGNIYYTELEDMSMQVFIIHALLSVVIFSLCGLWSHNIKTAGETQIVQCIKIGKLQEANLQKEALVAMSENLKISNERLQEVNKELRTIFNTIDEVLFSIDFINGRLVQLSAACEKITGWSRTSFMADNDLWMKLIYTDDKLLIQQSREKLLDGKMVAKKCRIFHKDGSIRWVEVKIIPTLNENKILTRIDGIVKDINEEKKSEAALQESYKKIVAQKKMMKTTEQIARFGSWQLDLTGSDAAVNWSDEAFRIYGYNPYEHEPSYEFFLSHVHPQDLEYVKATMENAYMNLNSQKLSFRIIDRRGFTKYLDAELMVERDAEGNPICVTGFKQDITEKILLENSLAEERENKQKEITAAVINAQEQERSFLGEELHDNINPILATAKLYMDSAIENEDIRITLIQNTKEFISSAMDDIRKLSKSLLPPTLGEISLLDALKDMIENISKVNELNFITEFEKFDESSISDKLKLAIFRIFQEQTTNILKHSHAKTVTISLKQHPKFLQFIIKDDGVGFDSNAKRQGVGLQNIISRGELYNGNVIINSAIGKGCELVVNFSNEIICTRNNVAKAS